MAPLPSLIHCSAGAALVIEADDPLGRARQVGHDEADTGISSPGMPFDLGYDAADGVGIMQMSGRQKVELSKIIRERACIKPDAFKF